MKTEPRSKVLYFVSAGIACVVLALLVGTIRGHLNEPAAIIMFSFLQLVFGVGLLVCVLAVIFIIWREDFPSIKRFLSK